MPPAASVAVVESANCNQEILTLDDVRQILEQQLAWIGVPSLTVGRIDRRGDCRIEAEIVDPASGGTHRRTFRTAILPASS